MIDSLRTGRNIVYYRQTHGWTQGELAQQLNVTHQAVSKWENGVALPDIATLLTLSQLFGVTMEQLLTGEAEAATSSQTTPPFKKIEPTDLHDRPNDLDAKFDEPETFEAFMEAIDEELEALDEEFDGLDKDEEDEAESSSSAYDSYDWNAIISLAPFASHDALHELIVHCEQTCDMHHLSALAPFISREDLDRLIRSSLDSANWDAIISLAPFASHDALHELIVHCEQTCDMHHLSSLAPFISREDLDHLIRRGMRKQKSSPSGITSSVSSPDQPINRTQYIPRRRRRTEIRATSPKLTRFASEVVSRLQAVCDATDPIVDRFEELRQALESQDYGTLNEFGALLDEHLGMEWLEKYAELCTEEEQNAFTQQINSALQSRNWSWIEDNAHLISDPQIIRHIVRIAASEGFFDFIPLFIDDLDQSVIDYAAQQASALNALDDILPFINRISPGILD